MGELIEKQRRSFGRVQGVIGLLGFQLLSCAHRPVASTQQGSGVAAERTALGDVASSGATSAASSANAVVAANLERRRLQPWLRRGLGAFLQTVQVDPQLAAGRFVGFRIVAVDAPSEPALGRYLQRGDVVLRVNGMSIEQPDDAVRVWSSLTVASSLVVDIHRGGEAMQLRFAIVDEP